MDVAADDMGAQLAAHVSIGAASVAYEQWLRDTSSDLFEIIHRAFRMVQTLPELEVTNSPPRRRSWPIVAR